MTYASFPRFHTRYPYPVRMKYKGFLGNSDQNF